MTTNVSKILSDNLTTIQKNIRKEMERKGVNASGETSKSIEVEVKSNEGILWANSYLAVLEDGRQAGKVPYDFQAILLKWAKAKGLTFGTQQEANRFAYLTAKKIERMGTQLYRGQGAKINLDKIINESMEQLSNEVSGFYEAEIDNLLREF